MSVERTRLTLQKFTEILESDFDKALGNSETICDDYEVLAQELNAAASRLLQLVSTARRREAHFRRSRGGRPWKQEAL